MELLREFVRRHRRSTSGQRHANIWIRQRSSALRQIVRRWPVPIYHLNTDLRRAAIAKEWADRCAGTLHQMTEFGRVQADSKALLEAVKYHADQWGFCPVLPSFDHYEQKLADGQLVRCLLRYGGRWRWPAWLMISGGCASWSDHGAAILNTPPSSWARSRLAPRLTSVTKPCRNTSSASRQTPLGLIPCMPSTNRSNCRYCWPMLWADPLPTRPVRRAELMVRMRGFEDLAESQGYVGEFYTWTAPSKYHSWKKAKKGPGLRQQKI